jgi:hypothetical protein
MKSIVHLPLLAVVVAGCATAGSDSDSRAAPLSWPAGRYELEGSVEYREDTESSIRTARTSHRGELEIESDGSMRLRSSSGICRDRQPNEVLQDQMRRERTFYCVEATYRLKPMGTQVRGTIAISVMEGIRRQGPCSRWNVVNGVRVCVEYSYVVRFSQTRKSTSLRVARLSQVQAQPQSLTEPSP